MLSLLLLVQDQFIVCIRRLSFRALPVSIVLSLTACGASPEPDTEVLQEEARGLAQRFVGTLLPTLQSAMAEGGPTQAIAVCSVQAPAIADQLAAESGWSVRRVSLKPRNSGRAIPDTWERQMLQEFDRRQQAGEAGATINASAIVDGEFRYLQAQPVMPLCLTCHGQNISLEVRNTLAQYYPDDLATGYTAGQIRGAISLRK